MIISMFRSPGTGKSACVKALIAKHTGSLKYYYLNCSAIQPTSKAFYLAMCKALDVKSGEDNKEALNKLFCSSKKKAKKTLIVLDEIDIIILKACTYFLL